MTTRAGLAALRPGQSANAGAFVVTRRPDDWHAALRGRPDVWAAAGSPEAALGRAYLAALNRDAVGPDGRVRTLD